MLGAFGAGAYFIFFTTKVDWQIVNQETTSYINKHPGISETFDRVDDVLSAFEPVFIYLDKYNDDYSDIKQSYKEKTDTKDEA